MSTRRHPPDASRGARGARLLWSAGGVAAAGAAIAALRSRWRTELVEKDRAALLNAAEGLRRLAPLVAQEAEPEEIFAAVAEEVGRLVSADVVHMLKQRPDGSSTAVGVWPAEVAGVRSTVSVPLVVDDELPPTPSIHRPEVAVLGAGPTAAAIVRRLVRVGFLVWVWDPVSARADALAPWGAWVRSSPALAAAEASVLITLLPNADATAEAMIGFEGPRRRCSADRCGCRCPARATTGATASRRWPSDMGSNTWTCRWRGTGRPPSRVA